MEIVLLLTSCAQGTDFKDQLETNWNTPCTLSGVNADVKPSTQAQVCTWIFVALVLQPYKSNSNRNCNTMNNLHSGTNGAEFEEKPNTIFQVFFFFNPPRPTIYLILLKDLFLTGLRFRNRNSQRGQPTLLAICSWHFLLASLHSLGQMFSIFCGLLIFLSYCLFRAVLQDAWSDMMPSLGWPGPWFPTFFKGFLTTHWHTSFQRDQSFQVMLTLLDFSC